MAQDIESLFGDALSGEYESELAWDAVRALQGLGTKEVFDRAAQLCDSGNPLARARGADVLGQLGRTVEHPRNNFPSEAFSVLAGVAAKETHAVPLSACITALGHLGDPRAIPVCLQHASNTNRDVRFSVAFALGCFPDEPAAITALLNLMEDNDEQIRDWATFGLGVLGSVESDRIREALILRTKDSDEDTREEALVGLAKRLDTRVVEPLIAAFTNPPVGPRIIEAADLILGKDRETEWNENQYLAALRQRLG